jgi:hypothetical protein
LGSGWRSDVLRGEPRFSPCRLAQRAWAAPTRSRMLLRASAVRPAEG